jgi:serine/threonine protein kinase
MSMKTPVADSFTQRLAASRLVSSHQLAQAKALAGSDEKALVQHLLAQGVLTRFQVRQLRAGARQFHVDKYTVVDYLGRGGNSIVFKARHNLLPGRYVALKTLDCRNLHYSEEALARFRREIEILGRLQHPHLVRALDVIHTRTQLYLVLEYIEGRDLGTLVKERGPLPIPEAVEFTIQAARGLAYAHACGVVHRDLKPANLLLTGEGVVKISDLGLARFFDSDATDLTTKGACLGTPEFMAPEQAEDASAADARSDVYSLGATLFHLLTGEMPVTGSSQFQRLQRLLTAPPRPLAEARPDMPADLAKIVDDMRARDPRRRPSSAEEVIRLLEPFTVRKKQAEPPRWDGPRRAAVVLAILQNELDVPEAAARHGLSVAEVETWRQQFVEAGEQALDLTLPEERSFREYLRDLHARLGTLALECETLKKSLATRNGLAAVKPAAS